MLELVSDCTTAPARTNANLTKRLQGYFNALALAHVMPMRNKVATLHISYHRNLHTSGQCHDMPCHAMQSVACSSVNCADCVQS